MAVFHPHTRLDSFVEGALNPSSRARVSAHLADCPDCRREVDQRERILRAAASLGPVAGPSAGRPAADGTGHRSVPVLEGRDGVAGWKVVLGLGAVGLLTSGVLMTAWVAGDPEGSDPDVSQSQWLSFAGDSTSATGADRVRSPDAPASGPASGTVPVSPAPEGTPGTTPADPSDVVASSAPAYLAPAGSILSAAAGITRDPVTRLSPSMVTHLRQAGWNVPTFHGLGMPDRSTGWQRGDGVAEVVVTLADDGHSLAFHECRALRDGEPAPACPVGAAAATPGAPDASRAPSTGPVTGALSWAGVDVVRLPVGVDMQLREHADGSWTAALATDQAGYSVDSDLPVENAPRVMSMVVISERSRVQGGAAPESPGDRLARGFERLLPWTGVTEPQRR